MKRAIAAVVLCAVLLLLALPASAVYGFDLPEDEFVIRLNALLEKSGLRAERFADAAHPYYTIGDSIDLWLTINENAVAELTLEGTGNAYAKSGQRLMESMLTCIELMSGETRLSGKAALIRLISERGGYTVVGEAAVSMTWETDGSVAMTVGRREAAPESTAPARPEPASLDELLDRCAVLLPDNWRQNASQLSQLGQNGNAIISIYMSDVNPDGAWEHALALMRRFWTQAQKSGIEANRLSLVYYSPSLAPVLSIAVDSTAAAASPIWADEGATVSDFHKWLLERQIVGDTLLYGAYE